MMHQWTTSTCMVNHMHGEQHAWWTTHASVDHMHGEPHAWWIICINGSHAWWTTCMVDHMHGGPLMVGRWSDVSNPNFFRTIFNKKFRKFEMRKNLCVCEICNLICVAPCVPCSSLSTTRVGRLDMSDIEFERIHHNSQLTTHNSQLTTHNSQLTTHNAHNSQLTI